MTRLINMDNGGTLTDFCLIDSEEVRYTKTLTTPRDLSRCLLDGLAKVSELAYGEPQLATRAVHRLHPVFHHPGRRPRRHPPDLVGSAQRVPAPGHAALPVQRRPAAAGRPGPPAVADLPAEADRVFAPSRPSLTRSRDEAGPILGATGPGLALRTPLLRSSL
jgi:hypothetical protein